MRLSRWAAALALAASPAAADWAVPERPEEAVRVAQFNAALARPGAGVLIRDLEEGDPQVANVVEIVARVRPDILVLNELDADPAGRSLALLRERLGAAGLGYPHAYQGAQNVGRFSGLDLDGDGLAAGPGDAWGYGRFPGQYAMAVLSRFPLGEVRSFTEFRWSRVPGARRPMLPDGTPFHPDDVWKALRLSSKSHWIVPVALASTTLHVIAAHPTPPVFDGPEDRNGARNADEIRLIRAIIEDADWVEDDAGQRGGVAPGTAFVVAGDLNADPEDGDGIRAEIRALLENPRLQDPAPTSPGAAAARENAPKTGDRARHTADWPEGPGKPGNLRVDYVLPSAGLEVLGAGSFWPPPGHPLAPLVKTGRRHASSDHRLVWVDIRLPEPSPAASE